MYSSLVPPTADLNDCNSLRRAGARMCKVARHADVCVPGRLPATSREIPWPARHRLAQIEERSTTLEPRPAYPTSTYIGRAGCVEGKSRKERPSLRSRKRGVPLRPIPIAYLLLVDCR